MFLLSFALVMLVGQAWNLTRTVEYRATTRLQIALPDIAGAGAASSAAFTTQLERITSRAVLGRVARTLAAETTAAAADGVAELQAMLQVVPVPDSEVVQVVATGRTPQRLASALNALPDAVRAELAERQAGSADELLAAARKELDRLETDAADRRARLERLHSQAGVDSVREDNDAVSRSRGLNLSLNAALEKEATAAARLNAVSQAAAAGRSSTQVRADPTLTALEARAHQTREALREMERSFTPQFMAMDPQAKAMRARLTELESQIGQQREVSQRAAVQSAQEDLQSAQATASRLRSQLAAARPALAGVSTRLAEIKPLEEDLQQIETSRREVLARVARLQANEQRRVATVTVLEPAAVPADPFRPDRVQDGLIVTAVAFVLALLATGTVELFNRVAVAPSATVGTTVVMSPGWSGSRSVDSLGHPLSGLPALSSAARSAQGPDTLPGVAAMLPAPVDRLDQPQAAALLAAATGDARLGAALGLLGLIPSEALALRHRDLDLPAKQLRVGGAWPRTLPLPEWLPDVWPTAAARPELLFTDAAGDALAPEDLEAMLASAALDAGLPHGAELRWDTLRQTCIDWLLGQGLRFTDLPARVGRVDVALLQALAGRHASARRHQVDAVPYLMPALQLAPEGSGPVAAPDAPEGPEPGAAPPTPQG